MIKIKSIQTVSEVSGILEIETDKVDEKFFDVLDYLNIPRRTENIEKEFDFDKESFFESQQKDEI